jgi:hypothetical protein
MSATMESRNVIIELVFCKSKRSLAKMGFKSKDFLVAKGLDLIFSAPIS